MMLRKVLVVVVSFGSIGLRKIINWWNRLMFRL